MKSIIAKCFSFNTESNLTGQKPITERHPDAHNASLQPIMERHLDDRRGLPNYNKFEQIFLRLLTHNFLIAE
jgi:hypothetical protein